MNKINKLPQPYSNFSSYLSNYSSTTTYKQLTYQKNYNYSTTPVSVNHSFNVSEINMLNLLINGLKSDLISSSYEEISPKIWELVDDLTEGVEPFLD